MHKLEAVLESVHLFVEFGVFLCLDWLPNQS